MPEGLECMKRDYEGVYPHHARDESWMRGIKKPALRGLGGDYGILRRSSRGTFRVCLCVNHRD